MLFTSARPVKVWPCSVRRPVPVTAIFGRAEVDVDMIDLAVCAAASTCASALTERTLWVAGRTPGKVMVPAPAVTSIATVRTSPWPLASTRSRPDSAMSSPRSSAASGDRSASIEGFSPSISASKEMRLRSRE